jgi:hypothetical protein
MKFSRRQFVRLTASVAALPARPSIARAQTYPTNPLLLPPIQADKLADSIGLNIKPEDFGRSYDFFWDSVVIPELVASGNSDSRLTAGFQRRGVAVEWCAVGKSIR